MIYGADYNVLQNYKTNVTHSTLNAQHNFGGCVFTNLHFEIKHVMHYYETSLMANFNTYLNCFSLNYSTLENLRHGIHSYEYVDQTVNKRISVQQTFPRIIP